MERNSFIEDVGLGYLYERDRGICQLCNQPVDLSLVRPDPMSPAVDHIIPLSKRGEHSKANTQLSHLGCNARKRDRMPAGLLF